MISVANRLNIVKVSSLSALWMVIELDPHLYHFQREMWPGGGGGGDSGIQAIAGWSKDFCGFEIFDFGILGRKILASFFFFFFLVYLDLSTVLFWYSKLMCPFFVLYHLMLSGIFCGSEIWHRIFLVLNFGPGIFWGLIPVT